MCVVNVPWCVSYAITFCTEIGIDNEYTDMNRPILPRQPTTRIFGGKFRLSVRMPNQPHLFLTHDWQSLHLNIQVRVSFLLVLSAWMSWCLTSRLCPQPDSIRTVLDALMRVSQSQVSASGLGNASQQVLLDALPPVLVLHLNRFRYDAVAGGIMKIDNSIQFAPELKIPLGNIFFFLATVKAENTSWFGHLRHYGTQCSTILGIALPSRRVCGWRALYSRCSSPERRQRHRRSLAVHQ